MLYFDVYRAAEIAGGNHAAEVDPLTGRKVNKIKITKLWNTTSPQESYWTGMVGQNTSTK